MEQQTKAAARRNEKVGVVVSAKATRTVVVAVARLVRHDLYRKTVPHAGFELLQRWGAELPHGLAVFTSNVDGQFQKAGFPSARVYEVGPAKFTQPPRPSDLRRSSLPSVPLSALRPTWRAAQIAAQKGP